MVISFLCRNGQQDKIDETKLTELEKIRALDYNPTNNASESSINNRVGVPEQANWEDSFQEWGVRAENSEVETIVGYSQADIGWISKESSFFKGSDKEASPKSIIVGELNIEEFRGKFECS